ncbi:hypothetical protein BD626DRAFT_515969 [Schizophyllum amplum]|uniref:Uncharacterized protein n=1 Tax=Schizophyllum amplum TaxID=97359 RepID=A0A550BX86_9AGAR|nr:hypothetical protein BD626DRAFT_515969 [Auriculariopsis ampla]
MPPVLRSNTKNSGLLREPNNTNTKRKRRISTHPYQLRSSAPPLKAEEVAERSNIAMHASNFPVRATATTTHEGRSTVRQALARLDDVVEKGLAAIRKEMTALRVDAIATDFFPSPSLMGTVQVTRLIVFRRSHPTPPSMRSPLNSGGHKYLQNYGILTRTRRRGGVRRAYSGGTPSRERDSTVHQRVV